MNIYPPPAQWQARSEVRKQPQRIKVSLGKSVSCLQNYQSRSTPEMTRHDGGWHSPGRPKGHPALPTGRALPSVHSSPASATCRPSRKHSSTGRAHHLVRQGKRNKASQIPCLQDFKQHVTVQQLAQRQQSPCMKRLCALGLQLGGFIGVVRANDGVEAALAQRGPRAVHTHAALLCRPRPLALTLHNPATHPQ